MLRYIDRFGVKAVMGRDVLALHEMRNMLLVESVELSYHSRRASADWGKWAKDHPDNSALLIDIEKQLNAD